MTAMGCNKDSPTVNGQDHRMHVYKPSLEKHKGIHHLRALDENESVSSNLWNDPRIICKPTVNKKDRKWFHERQRAIIKQVLPAVTRLNTDSEWVFFVNSFVLVDLCFLWSTNCHSNWMFSSSELIGSHLWTHRSFFLSFSSFLSFLLSVYAEQLS